MDVSRQRSKKRNLHRYLHRDIIAGVLSRLPIKSVVRFGCASKVWFEIVGDPDFQHSHLKKSLAAPPNVMALTREKGVITINLSHGRIFPPCDAAFGHIITSRPYDYTNTCNGLLCFVSPEDGSVLLSNPIIGELIALPPPPASAPPPVKYSVGLGFSPSTRDYKVVTLSYSPSAMLLTAEVCTLGTPASSWRHLPGPGGDPSPSPSPSHPLYVNGKIHWMRHKRIISFDVESEVFESLSNPDFGPDAVLVELGGNLSIIDLSSPCHIPVWVLNDPVHNRWDRPCIISTFKPLTFFLNPKVSRLKSIWEHGGSLLIWLADQWITYDFKTKQQRDVLGRVSCFSPTLNWEVCSGYRMSLVSLKSTHIAEGRGKGGVVTFAWDSDLSSAGMQNSLGVAIEKMGIVLKLLPDYARIETSSVRGLLSNYTRAVRADRCLLGPHIYRTPQQANRGVQSPGICITFDEKSNVEWLFKHGRLSTHQVDRHMIYKIWMGK